MHFLLNKILYNLVSRHRERSFCLLDGLESNRQGTNKNNLKRSFSGDKKWLGLVQPPGVCVGWLQLTGLKTDMRVLGVPPTLLGEPPLNSHLLPSYQLN